MSENTGQGSSGSWRDDEKDTTQNWQKGEDKLQSGRAFERRQRDHVAYQPISVRAQRRQAAVARAHNGLKPMRFVSLHHHSTYSFLDGFQLPEAHVRRATEINMGAVAMTEHGNNFSHVKLEKAAVEAGVKPIFGCEFYTGWVDKPTQMKNHLTVVAKDQIGYGNLLALLTRSWAEGFYYEPTVDPRWLVEHQEGLVVLSGCLGSALVTALVGGKHVDESEAGYERGLRVARWFDARLDDYYIEVQAFPELEKTRTANPMLARIAKQIRRPLVATMDCHYTAPEETEVQQVLHAVRPGERRTVEDLVRDWGYDVPLCPPPDDRSIYRRLRATGLDRSEAVEAIISTEEIAQEIHVELPRLPQPEFPLPEGFGSARELWRQWLRDGWRYRGCHSLAKAERRRYKAQLAHEMEIIEDKGYENYFLIVADSIRFAKDKQIAVGPARGSAAASLACYLLRITEVNPMDFDNLVFERFIDVSRQDMPDIDIDFATYGRPIVRDYLVEKFGEGCVNNVGTFTMYKSRMALDDAARVHQVPKRKVETVKELLIERSSGDLRASATIEDTVDQFDAAHEVFNEYPELSHAMDLEGNAKGFGVHAAGLVVSTEPITSITAVLEKEVKGELIQVVSMDKYDAERQGLDKLDYLGLSTMDLIDTALKTVGMKLEDLYDLPLDDPEVITGFQENDVAGVFQFDGRATRIVCGALRPDNFHELTCVNALSRPGPLHNGAVQGYVGAKHGMSEPERIHPALDLITADTYYQIIFQEQILRIVTEIGGFDWTHSAYIRRIISKKLGDQEFNRQGERFMEGAQSVHERIDGVPAMDHETAARIWGMCITAGSYAFNAAHSTAYSMIAYWCMWLKRKFPEDFYAAALAHLNNDEKLAGLRRDAVRGKGARSGIEVRPPAVDSGATWEPGDGFIRAGWAQVPGIGDKMAAKIVEAFPEGPPDWESLTLVAGIGPKKLDAIQAFANASDPFDIHKLDRMLDTTRAEIESGVLSLPRPTHTSDELYTVPANEKVTVLAQPVHRNLRDVFEANQAKTGVALDPSKVKAPHLSQWCVITARDSEETASFVISRFKHERFKEALWQMDLGGDDLILVTGAKGAMGGNMGYGSGVIFIDSMAVVTADE